MTSQLEEVHRTQSHLCYDEGKTGQRRLHRPETPTCFRQLGERGTSAGEVETPDDCSEGGGHLCDTVPSYTRKKRHQVDTDPFNTKINPQGSSPA